MKFSKKGPKLNNNLNSKRKPKCESSTNRETSWRPSENKC